MKIFAIVAACAGLLGCEDGRQTPIDAPVGTPDAAIADLTCAQIAAQLRDRLAQTPTGCTVQADCGAYGYPVRGDGSPTCNCGVTFAQSCGGIAVNRTAWDADAVAAALTDAWETRCLPLGAASGVSDLCDCTIGAINCVDQHCTSSAHDCFADAGP